MAEKVVIIGSGPAGWSAAIYAARANLEPLVFEGAITEENRVNNTLPLGQLALTTEVENYAGFPAGVLDQFLDSAIDPERRAMMPPPPKGHEGKHAVTGPELMELMRQQALNFGTRIITDDVVSVDLSKRPFKVISRDNGTVEAQALIVATGARANYLGLPSEDLYKNRGVSACAVCDGALPRFRNQPLIVVGGGDTACEEGHYLTKFASKVYLVYRRTRDRMPASKVMQERLLSSGKVEPIWNSVVEEVLGDDEKGMTGARIKNVQTGETMTIDAAGMFVAIGHTPNTKFLKGQLKANPQGYIELADRFTTYTSVEGVFAAGDVADPHYRQAITAAGMGCKAALDAERWLAAKGIH